MDKPSLLNKIKQLDSLSNDEKAYLVNLVNTKKKYGLVWEDKPEDVEEQLRTQLPVLKEVVERRIISEPGFTGLKDSPDSKKSKPLQTSLFDNNDNPNNNDNPVNVTLSEVEAPNHILIEGDNLHALTALTFTHEGAIDVIYIDPPYNTGNKDFKYNDSFVDREDSYRHSKWLSFMHKRLEIAKRLLSDKGVIFISIDDNEVAQLKILCDEIFGENFLRNIINTRRQDKNLSNQFLDKGLKSLAIGCEYVLTYSKTNEVNLKPVFREASEKRQNNGYWKGFWNAADRPTMRYDILGFTPKEGQWKWKESVAIEAIKNYEEFLLISSKTGNSLEKYWENTGRSKKFIKRNPNNTKGKNNGVDHWIPPSEGILRTSNWSDILTTQTYLDQEVNFSSPKNVELIKTIIDFGNISSEAIILDFFAGSGTTLHATMKLNAEDGGNRQCILVTNNENNIAEEVCYERNKRVIQGYTNSKGIEVSGLGGNNLRYYKTTLLGREPSLKNKRELTLLATELLCIKEDCYTEVTSKLGDFGWHKLFTNEQGNFVYVVYNDFYVEEAVEGLKTFMAAQSPGIKMKVYVFANGQYAYAEEFEEIAENITLAALPDAIYKAYQNVLPKENKEFIPELEDEIYHEPQTDTVE